MTELKPCPFCGSKVKLEDREFDDFAGNYFTNTMSMIECNQCGISMERYPKRGYGTTDEQKQELIDSWNRRDGEQEAQRDYEQSVEYAQYCERYEPTYNPEDGSM